MKRLISYKKCLALMLAGSMATSSYGQTNLPELTKELEIMSSILKTALKQNTDKSSVRFRNLDATYLANQGVVFEVTTSGGSTGYNFVFSSDGEFLSLPPLPAMPEIVAGEDFSIEISGEEEWEDYAEEAMERAREAMEVTYDKLRELRQKEREYSWERRELERRLRDHEFELRNADDARKKDLNDRNAEIQSELKALDSKQKEVEKYVQQLEAERKEKAAAQTKARQEQYKTFLSNFEVDVADTLCKYGAGLKTLPDNENVTFILPDFVKTGRDKQDRIYVFAVDDIQSCVRGKIDSTKLLSKSSSYLF